MNTKEKLMLLLTQKTKITAEKSPQTPFAQLEDRGFSTIGAMWAQTVISR